MDIVKLISSLTLEEKAALVAGTDFMYTNPVPRLRIPSLCMADGPHGLRKQISNKDNGIEQSEPATVFPTAVAAASSWNPENTFIMGKAIAKECRYYGVGVLLGPGVNIKRNPLCGRNFEYFSEDPLLAGKMGAAEVCGVQSEGVGVSVKHYALNNSEDYRFMGNSVADMRAIREIYLKVFEIIVKESNPATIMCAYNQINGTYCSENKWLLTDVLRNEWGFDGLIMTDWGAIKDRVESLKAGLDLEMPGDTKICRKWILDAVRDRRLPMETLDAAVENVLKLIEKYAVLERCEVDFDEHDALAAEIAADCAVLLKNDGTLPLNCEESILVVGELFEKMRYQGAGSSMINPTKITTPKNAFDSSKIHYEYVRGYNENSIEIDKELIDEAVQKAKNYDTILVFAGLTDYVESEGCDRKHMRLPDNQLAVLDNLIKTGHRIVVILFGGSVVELPFADHVNAVLHMFLPGQNGGTAVKQLIFGEKNPGGRLAESWPYTYADVPFGENFSQCLREVYRESIYVGYRYYLTAGINVRYPFGFGLSYTSFAYENMKLEHNGDIVSVTCDIHNTGGYDGAEVVQLYVKAPQSDVFKPIKELRAFRKVYLRYGEQKTVTLKVDIESLRYYHTGVQRWVLENGIYEFQLCRDCTSVIWSEHVMLKGEDIDSPYSHEAILAYKDADISKMTDDAFEAMSGIKIPELPHKFPITMNSRFTDLQQTFFGRILFKAVLSVAHSKLRKAQKMPEGIERDNCIKGALFMKRVLESNSLYSMSMSAGDSFPYNYAEGFAALANGHIIKGIKSFLTPIKVPKLPKEHNEGVKNDEVV